MSRIDDTMLMAYVDGEVDHETAREIETSILADPALARRVATMRQTAAATRAAFTEILHEPVPDRLTALFAGPAAAPAATRATLVAPRTTQPRRASSIWRHSGWAAAAAIAAVALLHEGARTGFLPITDPFVRDIALGPVDTERWIDNLAAWYRVHAASFEKDQRLLVDVGAENLEELERWVGTKLQRDVTVPDLTAFGLRSEGGRLLLIGRRPAAQFFYAGEGQELVQVVIGFTDQPDRGQRIDQREDVNIVSWRDKGYAYAFIGRIDGQRLARMADASWAKLKPA